jgi:hypothetical protein
VKKAFYRQLKMHLELKKFWIAKIIYFDAYMSMLMAPVVIRAAMQTDIFKLKFCLLPVFPLFGHLPVYCSCFHQRVTKTFCT